MTDPPVTPAVLGRAVRTLREERGMTQDELGQRTGIACEHISRIELGEVDAAFTTFIALFQALDASYDELHDLLDDAQEPSS